MATLIMLDDPVPGACNQEFPLENDPNLFIPQQRFIHPLEFQYANIQGHSGGGGKMWQNCEDRKMQQQLQYDVYQLFLDERHTSEEYYLRSMGNLLDVTTFKKKASLVKTIVYGEGQTRVDFAAYHRQGVMYRVVVRQNHTRFSSYVPVVSFTCDKRDGQCDMTNTPGLITIQVVSVILAVCGIIMCYVGHRLFKTSMFFFGFLGFTIIFVSIFMRFTTWETMVSVLSAGALGVVGGVTWLVLWYFCGIPVVAVLMPGLVMGYLVSSLVFVTSPLDNIGMLQNSFNYGMCFTCGILVPCVLLLAFSRILHIVACTCVGSYLVVFAIDWFLHGSIRYIITISIKKSIADELLTIYNNFPFQYSDILLSVLWILLFLSGLTFQYWRERGRPDFPPCPWREYQHRRRRLRAMSGLDTREFGADDESDPLLSSQRESSGDRHVFRRYTDEDDERDLFSPPRDQRPFMFRSPSHATSSQTSDSRRAPLQREVAGFYDHQSPNSSRVIVDPM